MLESAAPKPRQLPRITGELHEYRRRTFVASDVFESVLGKDATGVVEPCAPRERGGSCLDVVRIIIRVDRVLCRIGALFEVGR